jgi:phage baseplate assembly protein W
MDIFTEKFIKEHINNQLEKYEPRVTLDSIEIENIPEYNRMNVKINYYYILQDKKIYDSIIIRDLNTLVTRETL